MSPEVQKHSEPLTLQTDTPNLILRQMDSVDDDEQFFELQNANLEYWKEFGNSIDKSIQEVTERRLRRGDGRFGIWLEDKLVGMIGYYTDDNEQEAEIGITIDKNASGKGIATASLLTLTDYIKPRFKRVFAETAPDNVRSIKLLNRAGYETNGENVKRNWGEALVFEAPK